MLDKNLKDKIDSYLSSIPKKIRYDVEGALSRRDEQLKSIHYYYFREKCQIE